MYLFLFSGMGGECRMGDIQSIIVISCQHFHIKVHFGFFPLLFSHCYAHLCFRLSFRRLAVPSQCLTSRLSPFPKFNWADPDEVWSSLCRKDRLYKRNHDYILAHPSLQPRMRAILLDWLVEVYSMRFFFFLNIEPS